MESAGLMTEIGGGNDSFTIFAPTNEAFEKMSEEDVEDEEKMKAMLQFLVIPMKVGPY